jgi:hypothetical protein
MIMQVVIDGKKVSLDPKDALGDGGEANVIRHGGLAVKIYHTPSKERSRKIEEMIRSVSPKLPDTVVAPKAMVFDGRGKAIGFTMRCLPGGYEVVASLSKKTFRSTNSLGTKAVTGIFQNAFATLDAIHKAGAVVGDLNDLNELFSPVKGDMAWIDVDSFQIAGFPCEVAMETFLDPKLYGPDTTAPVTTAGGKPRIFVPENDWYSFTVMLFRSLTLVHPYGGVDPDLPTIPRRAKALRSVFSSKVKYPSKVGYSLEVLSDDVISYMKEVFDQGRRGLFPAHLLLEYHDCLVTCKKCQTDYPGERKRCPSCAATTPVAPVVTTKTDVEVLNPIRADGYILAFWSEGSVMFAVLRDRIECVRSTRSWAEPIQHLSARDPIDVSGSLLSYIDAHSRELIVISGVGSKSAKSYSFTTESFDGRPVFGVSSTRYYRLASGMLMRGEPGGGEEVVTSVMQNQTWFRVAKQSPDGRDVLFGCSRIFGQRHYFIVVGKTRADVDQSVFDGGGVVIDESVAFSSQVVAVLQRLKSHGVEWVRTVYLDHNGQLLAKYTQKTSDRLAGSSIHGAALGGKSLLVAGEHGIVREKFGDVKDNSPAEIKLFSATDPFVEPESMIGTFDGQLAVTHGGNVRLLKMS